MRVHGIIREQHFNRELGFQRKKYAIIFHLRPIKLERF